MDEVNFFTQLLWGTGAVFGHFLIVILILLLKKMLGKGMGTVVTILMSTIMMLLTFANATGSEMVFVIVYLVMILTVGL